LISGKTHQPDEPEIVTSSGECWEMFMAVIFAFHTGKAVVQITAIPIPINNLLNIRPPESVLP
jgi:hypothetical protein